MPALQPYNINPLHNPDPNRRFNINVRSLVPILFVLTVLIALLMSMSESMTSYPLPHDKGEEPSVTHEETSGDGNQVHYRYTTIKGYFTQDLPTTNASAFDAMKHNFGLIHKTYDTDSDLDRRHELTDWQRFAHKLVVLNKEAPGGTTYRLLYVGRHGQGYHNLAEKYYGTEAWNCYWSMLEGEPDKTATSGAPPRIVWADAHLSRVGESQASDLNSFWRRQLTKEQMPAPKTYYSSPLVRACQTAEGTFASLDTEKLLPPDAPFRPVIKELLREGNGLHTCDRRSSKSEIEKQFAQTSHFRFEEGFAEADQLWKKDLREPYTAMKVRLTELLDDVFTHDDSTYISMTAHSGTIKAILQAVDHRPFALPVGGALPILVRVDTVPGKRPAVDTGPWEEKPECASDPKKAGLEGFKDLSDYVKYIEDQAKRTTVTFTAEAAEAAA